MSFLKVPVFGAEPYGFKATDVSGCRAWFDAADVTTLYSSTPITGMPTGYSNYEEADNARVTVWEDKSIGGNDMIRNLDISNFSDTSPIYQGPPIRAPDVSNLTALAVVNFDQGNNTGSGDAGGDSNAPSFLQQNLGLLLLKGNNFLVNLWLLNNLVNYLLKLILGVVVLLE